MRLGIFGRKKEKKAELKISAYKKKVKKVKTEKKSPKNRKKIKSVIKKVHKDIIRQSKHLKARIQSFKHIKKDIEASKKTYRWTGIEGLDKLFDDGIIKGTSIIIAGGTGTGKTILTLQIMHNCLKKGEKCLYMTLEESEEKLISHMTDFGWDGEEHLKNNQLIIKRVNPFDLVRSVDALLARAKGELLIDINPIILPAGFKPENIFIDSLTAMAAAFTEKDETYRIYIEQFFRYLESTKATSFLVTETDQLPIRYSPTGVEEFLADGVIVLYNLRKGSVRQRAVEVLKMRGVSHKHKIVLMDITHKGVAINPAKETSF